MAAKFPPTRFSRRAACYGLIVALCLAGVFVTQGIQIVAAEPMAKDDSKPPESTDAKAALAEFNDLIGEWRGVGMPKRGSRVGAWFESAEWIWDFAEKTPALRYDVEKGQLLESARLTWNPKEERFELKATLPDRSNREYAGRLDEAGKLILESPADGEGVSHRITVTRLNEKRTLVLHETRTGQGLYRRVAEVGYTREGTSLASAGAGELECIVTGGKGTIKVSYKGKTYYVCCTGCQQAFEDDPDGTIAAFEKKIAERKAKPK